jgi:CRP-like cAMP-binding protein
MQAKHEWTRGRILRHPFAAMNEMLEVMTQLEEDVNEMRQLSKRVAELTDVVAELLLPTMQQDTEKLRRLLVQYDKSLT